MNTQEVANQLVELCRADKFLEAIDQLYSKDVVSREPQGAQTETTEGFEEVRNKTAQWINSVEKVHSSTISDPIVSTNFFSCIMDMDVTFKNYGRMPMSEICVYEVKDGKIVSDTFFYNMPG